MEPYASPCPTPYAVNLTTGAGAPLREVALITECIEETLIGLPYMILPETGDGGCPEKLFLNPPYWEWNSKERGMILT